MKHPTIYEGIYFCIGRKLIVGNGTGQFRIRAEQSAHCQITRLNLVEKAPIVSLLYV
jgi:hypothetical protein